MASGAHASERKDRSRDADRTKAEILQIATREFADRGYTGARVDDIAAKTSTTKRMLYYYFGDKEGLYLAVLENAYLHIRGLEQELDVDHLGPTEALRRLAEITFDHHETHEDFIRLVSIENIHNAEHLKKSAVRAGLAGPAIDVLTRILKRGKASGAFRKDIDALDLHMIISSYCVFRTANRHTFGAIFDRDLLDPTRSAHMRRILGDMVVSVATTGRR